MPVNVHKQLFQISGEFFKLAPWHLVSNEDTFGLFLKDKNQLYFVCIMGSGGLEYGLLLMQGWEGYHALTATSTCDIDHDTMANITKFFSVSIPHRNEIHPRFLNYHRKYDPNFNSSKPFYSIMTKEPAEVFRPPKDDEAETLCLCIKTLIELFHENLLQPATFKNGNKIKIFDVTIENTNVYVTGRYENIMTPKPKHATFEIDEKKLNQLKALPKLPAIYNMAAPSGMVAIKEVVPRILLIHDEKTDVILVMQAVYEENLIREVFNILEGVFSGKNFLKLKGLPQEIRTDSRLLYDSYKQILASLGIRVICVESIPKVRQIIKEMQHFSPRGKHY